MTQLFESIKMALAALTANKMRAVLTTLGVVIGITFVLMMGWALGGLDSALEQTLAIMGDDILYVDKWSWGGGDWIEQRNRKSISYQQYEKVKSRLQLAEYVVPTARRGAKKVQHGDLQLTSADIFGTTHEYAQMLGGQIDEGRFFNEAEDNAGTLVAVLGFNIAEKLFPEGDPIGKTIRIDGLPMTVIGTMPKRGTMLADFVDNQIIIPLRRFLDIYGKRSSVTINVKAGGTDRIEDVRYETIGVMRQVRSVAPGMKDDFGVNTQEQFRQQTDQIRYGVWGIGLAMTGLSFLVGSIGIMNIMFVSVTERTKEIGIRKAVGATRSSILLQFLVEAVILCLIGAAIGFGITSALTYATVKVLEVEFLSATVQASQIVIAVIVSIIVGVLAGIIPAFRAARMDPVEALRAE